MKVLFFTGEWCTRCPGVKSKLTAAGIPFELVDVAKKPDIGNKHGVRNLPVVLVLDAEGNEVLRAGENVSVVKVKELLGL